MNYILELKAFYNWLEINPISTSAIVLWHALMDIANKTYWEEKLSIPLSILQIKTGLKKDAIISARRILCEAGRITVTEKKGMQSCIYSLIPFGNYEKKFEIAAVKPPIYKLNNTKQNNTKNNNKNKTMSFENKSLDIDEINNFWDNVPKLV